MVHDIDGTCIVDCLLLQVLLGSMLYLDPLDQITLDLHNKINGCHVPFTTKQYCIHLLQLRLIYTLLCKKIGNICFHFYRHESSIWIPLSHCTASL